MTSNEPFGGFNSLRVSSEGERVLSSAMLAEQDLSTLHATLEYERSTKARTSMINLIERQIQRSGGTNVTNEQAELRVTLLDTKGNIARSLSIPMPEGFRWDAETVHLTDFTAQGEVHLVAGVQINAVNPKTSTMNAGSTNRKAPSVGEVAVGNFLVGQEVSFVNILGDTVVGVVEGSGSPANHSVRVNIGNDTTVNIIPSKLTAT